MCAGCRNGAALSSRRLSIPSQAHCTCGLCQTAPLPRVNICQGFSHRRMQSDWENLGECDLKSPAWLWDTKGQCLRRTQQRGAPAVGWGLCVQKGTPLAILAALRGVPAPVTCHMLAAAALHILDKHQHLSWAQADHRWTSSFMGKSPPQKQTQVSESKTLLIQSEMLFLASPGSFQIGWGSFTKGKPRSVVVSCERCFDQGPDQMTAAFRQNSADGKKPASSSFRQT